jgi:hypothetical protein
MAATFGCGGGPTIVLRILYLILCIGRESCRDGRNKGDPPGVWQSGNEPHMATAGMRVQSEQWRWQQWAQRAS